MQKITPEEGQSANMIEENFAQLKALFPDAFTESGVNFDVLRQLLGDASVLDEGEEKYGLTWYGKKQARQIALTPSMGTLLPRVDESVNWNETRNVFVEGDNLEVLKIMQKSYANQVKLIYIDPPYNTGTDFVYPDNFQDNLDTYLRYTGQKGDDGFKLSTNVEAGGRFHGNWLNMMLPRLKVAKNILSRDGVIFISIDDYELDNLLKLCDEVFGEENWLGTIPAIMNLKGNQDEYAFAGTHEYLVVYAKSKKESRVFDWPLEDEEADEWMEDERGVFKKGATLKRTGADAPRSERPKGWFPIFVREDHSVYVTPDNEPESPNHVTIWPLSKGQEMSWRWSKAKVEQESFDIIVVGEGDELSLYKKQRPSLGDLPSKKPKSFFYKPQYSSGNGTAEMEIIFGSKVFNPAPKPIQFLKDIILIGAGDGGLVMDFFAGSGSFAQAVMELNAIDGKERQWISVQLPQPIDASDTKNAAAVEFLTGLKRPLVISELTKERIRRAGKQLSKVYKEAAGDIGFRAFSLDSSSFQVWNPDRSDLEGTLLSHQDHIIAGRTQEDLLFELLLKRGVPLTSTIEEREVSGKVVYCIGYGVLFACLSPAIGVADVDSVAQAILEWHSELEPETDSHVFFRDSAFADDIAKTNMAAILEQNGISHVRSL